MSGVYGLFATPESAQEAFNKLIAHGVRRDEILILSSEPFEDEEFASHDRKTIMPWIAVGGAVLGLTTGYLLTSTTQQSWPINTGGMPIVSNWTNIIVMFELTMLGAVLATVITFLRTAGLPRRLPKFYDPAVSEGKILVGVPVADDSSLSEIELSLRAAGAELLNRTTRHTP